MLAHLVTSKVKIYVNAFVAGASSRGLHWGSSQGSPDLLDWDLPRLGCHFLAEIGREDRKRERKKGRLRKGWKGKLAPKGCAGSDL